MNDSPFLKKENGIKKLLPFLESGIFLINLTLIVIVVFFGVLNYFNILSISTIYPNLFSFLPHQ